jgi:hypothetical protein
VVQLTRSGLTVSSSAEDLRRLRTQFDRQHCIQLPSLLEADVLGFIQQQIHQAGFFDKTHKNIGTELCMTANAGLNLLYFLSNDGRFFQLVRQLTGCDHIGAFTGRVYRMVPGTGHYDSWHSDCVAHRMIGMSVNLSLAIYTGGVFQLRARHSTEILTEAPNTGPGDAILFRIADHLEHQVTSVSGTIPKTAFAGWFVSAPDFLSLLSRNDPEDDTS